MSSPPWVSWTEVHPDTKEGVYTMLGDLCNDSLPPIESLRFTADPQVQGVWLVEPRHPGAKFPVTVVYLAGYSDLWGKVRDTNDFESEE